MAARVAKFVVKSAVAGSLIYVTLRVANGPWIAPHNLAEHRGYIAAPVPTNQEESSPEIFKETWNKGVKKIFNGLHEAPATLTELSQKAMTQLKDSYKNSSK